jgi:hypothetical protein
MAVCALGTGVVCGRATVGCFKKSNPANPATPASNIARTTLGLMPENLQRLVEK